MSTDILESLPKLYKTLLEFRAQLFKFYFYKLLKKYLPREYKNLRLQNLFFDDLKKQFKRIIVSDGKYVMP